MKLLGWMQHRLRPRPTNIEPFKDSTIGNYYAYKSTRGYGNGSKPESENSFTEYQVNGEEDKFGDEASAVISGLFDGFLTIGTLGSEPVISEPVTPTFAMPLENMAEEKTEVTQDYLKLINDELEKFLEAEAEEHVSNESSRRNSQVSIITLSGTPMKEANAQDHGKKIMCPLQGYLLGSSIELAETRFEVKKERASLAELFYKTRTAEEGNPMEKCGKEEMQIKHNNKPVKHLIKKILNKIHASSGNSNSISSKETNYASTKKKFQKVKKLFHRKVHPESSIADRESKKLERKKMSNAPYREDEFLDGTGLMSMTGTQDSKTILKPPQYDLAGCTDASPNGEHWIKTDADYLVLEL